MTRALAAVCLLLGGLLPGCGASQGGSGTTTGSSSSSSTSSSTSTSTSTGTGATTAVSTGDAPTSGDSGSFAIMPDLPAPGAACDPWQDACPAGQKCKPYAVGLGVWTAASCVPIADPPIPTGDACLDPEWSITDACERGSACHGFFGDEEGRRCHEVCTGTPIEPTCSDACSWCFRFGDAIAGVCLFPCDPRGSDCPDGQHCQVLADAPRFACSSGPGPNPAGEPCTSPGWCAAGTACVDAALLPSCAGDRCCAPICDLDGPDACAAALPGTACAPWPVSGPEFEPACLPAGLGLCAAA